MSPGISAPQGSNPVASNHTRAPPSQGQSQPHRTLIPPPAQITPIPIPQPRTQTSPPLYIQTKPTTPAQSQTQLQPAPPTTATTEAPARPTVSPLTPPQAKAQLAKHSPPNFAQGRPTLTHSSQQAQTAIAPPPPEPLDFESNPDAIALRSAIAILQNQRSRAIRDIQALQKAKDEAINNPEDFVADLLNGRAHVVGDAESSASLAVAPSPEVSSDSSSEDDAPPAESSQAGLEKLRRRQERSRRRAERAARKAAEPSWTRLPGPQNVVRCPPVNWSKYAVVGESLDKIHAEQLVRPPEGHPATVGPTGMYEFRASEGGPEVGPAKEYLGIAAPYNPSRDQIAKKPKGRR